MKLIVGLGNPGPKYEGHRHNIGFMALDQIARDHGFGPWRGKHQGSVSEGRFGSDRAVLLKPETFMNNSGQAVQAAMRFYKIGPADVIVLHDEIDLAPGKVKYKTGGGMPVITDCDPSMPTSAPTTRVCGWASGIPVTKTACPLMYSTTFPKRITTGWTMSCAGSVTAPPFLQQGMPPSSAML